MKRHHVLMIVAIVILALALSLWTLAVAQGPSDSQLENTAPDLTQGIGSLGSDSNPTGSPEVFIPERYQPSAVDTASTAAAPPAATVYFTPQDEDTSTTVLFLYNTGTITATVGLRTYRLNGALEINATVAVPPAWVGTYLCRPSKHYLGHMAGCGLDQFPNVEYLCQDDLASGGKGRGLRSMEQWHHL